jgi:hypothetical protein
MNQTSLNGIPELSFTKTEAGLELQNFMEESKRVSAEKEAKNKIFIANRNLQSPPSERESNLLCNEDLDFGLIYPESQIQERHQNFAGMVNPECINIPSDISQFEKWYKSEASSNIRNDEGFEEFMRWGNKFVSDSKNNSPVGGRTSNDNFSFTFTKKDDKSPQKEFSRTHTDESKFDQVEIEECSSHDLPTANIPKRSAMSGAGIMFEKHILDKMNLLTNVRSSRNNSHGMPETQSHKSSLTRPISTKVEPKRSPVAHKSKPYYYGSDFQWGSDHIKRSRNPSQTNSYFTTESKPKFRNNDRLTRLSRTNESKMSKNSDSFRDVEVFTFAKQTPKMKNTPIKTPNPKNSTKKSKAKGSFAESSKVCSSITKFSNKARSSEKKNSIIGRQITLQASKRLSYQKATEWFQAKRNTIAAKEGIRNIKQTTSTQMKKNLIQSMLTNKLSTTSNMKIKLRQKPPIITADLSEKPSKHQTSNSKESRKGYSINYAPKYRKSNTKEKLLDSIKTSNKLPQKENISRNLDIFSPIISMNDQETSSSASKSPVRKTSLPKSNNYKMKNNDNLNNSEIQKILKMNLELIHTFTQGIEASKSIVSALTEHNGRTKEELNRQLKKIEILDRRMKSNKFTTEIKSILKDIKRHKFIR